MFQNLHLHSHLKYAFIHNLSALILVVYCEGYLLVILCIIQGGFPWTRICHYNTSSCSDMQLLSCYESKSFFQTSFSACVWLCMQIKLEVPGFNKV